jgi:hypothetical protein
MALPLMDEVLDNVPVSLIGIDGNIMESNLFDLEVMQENGLQVLREQVGWLTKILL